MSSSPPILDAAATARHVADIEHLLGADSEVSDFSAIVRRLGAHGEGSRGVFGFWIPFPTAEVEHVELELFLPPAAIDLGATEAKELEFERVVLPMTIVDGFAWAIVDGLEPGTRHRCGPLYQALVTVAGERRPLIDPLAVSTPFGAFAPSELIDSADLFDRPEHRDHFRKSLDALGDRDADVPRLGPVVNILQVHVPTATEEGSLAGLARTIAEVGRKVVSGEPLTASDELWLGYDSIQLMPVEPTIRREAGPHAWEILDRNDHGALIRIRRPTTTNWGYDVIIGGSAAVNPALLETGRPHELSDLAAVLHAFPTGPIHLILDVVYGHADNQALAVMPTAWFTGPDMYGQHLDYRNPIVRSHLLEMQRRKANHGVDGIRVDGAQDFTWWDADHGILVHDDEYLLEMSAVVQEAGAVRYRPWMIFEDGRPWPRADWELASSYRSVTERQPHVYQWGPLTFAHNTPFLFTFWLTKWWRLREVTEVGGAWISGCANHDTLRRGSQVDPKQRINTYLGEDLPSVIQRSYDHPASALLFHAFLPGVPMDFLQGIARAPWSFIRNTDDRYAVKVWAEETYFLDWRVPSEVYDRPNSFVRLKQRGFADVESLHRFMSPLQAAVAIHGNDVDPVIAAAGLAPRPAGFAADRSTLVAAAHDWMDDVHDLCNVSRHLAALDPAQTRFDLEVRRFRMERPWLGANLRDADSFDYLHPADGAVVFHGVRHGPNGEQVLFVANMEGAPREITPTSLPGVPQASWRVALTSPGVGTADAHRPVVLTDGEGVVFVDRTEAPAAS